MDKDEWCPRSWADRILVVIILIIGPSQPCLVYPTCPHVCMCLLFVLSYQPTYRKSEMGIPLLILDPCKYTYCYVSSCHWSIGETGCLVPNIGVECILCVCLDWNDDSNTHLFFALYGASQYCKEMLPEQSSLMISREIRPRRKKSMVKKTRHYLDQWRLHWWDNEQLIRSSPHHHPRASSVDAR